MASEKAWGLCPQCGGRVELEVGDPLLRCAFCKTRLYIRPAGSVFSYILPPLDKGHQQEANTVFLPYWRLKGFRFRLLSDKTIKTSRVDSSLPALPGFERLPPLGLVTQLSAMRLDTGPIRFVEKLISPQKALRKIDARIEAGIRERPLSSFILGEKISLVNAPFEFIEKEETVLLRPLWDKSNLSFRVKKDKFLPFLKDLSGQNGKTPSEEAVRFVPLICPECGSDIPALSMASVVFCRACKRLWALGSSRFLPKKAKVLFKRVERNAIFLPFYHFSLHLEGFFLKNRLDFLSSLYSYKRFPEGFSKEPIQVVIPSFSLNPGLFVRLGKRMTASPLSFLTSDGHSGTTVPEAHCINLGVESAIQSIPFLLMSIVKGRKKLMKALEESRMQIRGIRLIFIPFERKGHELVEPVTGQAIPEAALQYGLNIS